MSKASASAKEQQTTALVAGIDSLASDMPEWMKQGSRGSEEVKATDMVLPRIDLLQALNPQIKKSDPAYIEGAEQGLVYNTVTNELYGSSVLFVPVKFRREFLLWKTRKAGGGLLGVFKSESEADNAHCQQESPNDCEVVEAHQHFGLVLGGDGRATPAVFSMTRSKMKVSRALNSLVQMAEADRWARAYRFTAIEASSQKGDYWSFRVSAAGWVSPELYTKGEELYKLIESGAADVDRSGDHDDEPAAPPAGF